MLIDLGDRVRLALLAAMFLPGCLFDPDRSTDDEDDDSMSASEGGAGEGGNAGPNGEGDDGGPMCAELEDPCEVNGDCPCFDGTTEIGAGLCVSDGEGGVCTGVCQVNADCQSDCCADLQDNTEYGACAPAYVCDGGGTTGDPEPSEECIEGVVFFCACADWAGVPCTEDELGSFAGTCGSPGTSLYDVFVCWGSHASDSSEACGAALDACEIE